VRNSGKGFRDAIAATVMGGTFLAGGQGSVFPTLVGVLLIGMMYNLLNLEGTITPAARTPWWLLTFGRGFSAAYYPEDLMSK